MKVTINPTTGEAVFDVDTVEQALEIARRAQGGQVSDELPPRPKPTSTAELSEASYAAWDYLVANENVANGVRLAAVARHLKINHGAAGARLSKLVEMGYADRIGVGRYVAICPDEKKPEVTEL